MTTAVVGLVTCGSRAEARKVARTVLLAKAAACVNIMSGAESHYWWQGKLERAPEFVLVIKTTRARCREVIRLVKEVHSYEVPEILFVPVVLGERKYMKWLRSAVAMLAVLFAMNGWADRVDELIGKLGASEDEVRAEAADELTRIGGPRVVQKFREMLTADNPERRQMAVVGLLQVSDDEADVERIRSRLRDDNITVRWTAVTALAAGGWTEAVPWLEELAKSDGAESVREAAAEAVAKLRGGIAWRRSLPVALQEAAGSRHPVLAYFYVRQEPLCEQFEEGVLGQPVVVEATRDFVAVRLEAMRSSETARQYDVRGVPTLLVLDAGGGEMARLTGLVSVEQLVARLGEARRGKLTLREARRQAERDPTDVLANWRAAEGYLDEGREDFAERHLKNVLAYDIENRHGYTAQAMFALGFNYGKRRQHARAVYCLEELLRRWPEFKDKDKALYCLGLSRLALGQQEEGRGALEQVVRDFPASAVAQAAKPILVRLAEGKR